MTEKSILLIGAGGHAKSCIDVIEQQGDYSINGLIATTAELGKKLYGHEVIGTDDSLDEFRGKAANALIVVGQIQSASLRKQLYSQACAAGFTMPAIVSRQAYVSPYAKVGNGTIAMPGAIISAGAVIGENCIINTGAKIDHDVVIGNHCHISTGTIVNGGVVVGAGCFIGSGAVVREGLQIGEDCFIGMAVRLLEDLPVNSRVTNLK